MKFLIDRCAGVRIAARLRELGHDVAEVRDRGADPGDRTILNWGLAEERIVVTMDKDFGQFLFAEKAQHRGLIRLPDVPSDQRILIMESLLDQYAEALEECCVITVRGGRIRVSRSE